MTFGARSFSLSASPVSAEERLLAGAVGSGVYFLASLSLAAIVVLPGIDHRHWPILIALAAAGCVWGAVGLQWINWERAPRLAFHLPTLAALAAIAVGVASSGVVESPVWIDLFLIAVYVAYFFRPGMASLYLVGCTLVQLAPLLYDHNATRVEFLGQALIAGTSYLGLGTAIVAAKRRMVALRGRAERLATEQGALRRVATAVVGGESAETIHEMASVEIAHLLGAGAAGILRVTSDRVAVVTGSWAERESGRYVPGTEVPIVPGSDFEQALVSGRPVRVAEHAPESPVSARLGATSSIVVPIRVGGKLWGILAAASEEPDHFTTQDEQHLTAFGDLLAAAVVSLEDRAKLAAQALSDPLTGLANHRALQERLRAEAARAARHGSPLSVAVLDIDNFKEINDSGGHEAGDEALVEVARCLQRLARVEDTVGRLGGDEFAWLLPETNQQQALVAVERARRMIAAVLRRPYRITVSSGICDTSVTVDPADLINCADAALYWSKAHGRNQAWTYDPTMSQTLSAGERAERLQRTRALVGLRALARAIDAKDPATSQHSERVAALSRKLALTVGWSEERAELLSEAALVHDVGKIGIPDHVLRKPGLLSDSERDLIKTHAELAARIVEDILTPEQVAWIRTHHERPDGAGYPRGLRGHEIPEGAALLAAADAWDVMTSTRSYSSPKTAEDAMVECIDLVGRQFSKTAVTALARLHASGELGGESSADELAAV